VQAPRHLYLVLQVLSGVESELGFRFGFG
jgi:hypothetical protein